MFVAPEPLPPASIEELVHEGTMIAGYAVRMSVKNLLIVSALGSRIDYDEERYLAATRSELVTLAAENRADAARIEELRLGSTGQWGQPKHQHDYQMRDSHALKRRQAVYEGLADELTRLAGDDDFLSDTVARARAEAWGEVGATIEARLPDAQSRDLAAEPGHARRVRALIADDLDALRRTRESKAGLDEIENIGDY